MAKSFSFVNRDLRRAHDLSACGYVAKPGWHHPASGIETLPERWNRILSRMFRFRFRFVFQILFLGIGLLLAETSAAQRVKVSLNVAGPDDTKNKIFNYLVADLAQRGVDLVGSGSDYQIRIIAVHLESKKRRGAGYAVSVAVIAPVSADRPRHGFRHPLVAHFLEVGPRDGLEDLCKRVADGINTEVFDVHRRAAADSG